MSQPVTVSITRHVEPAYEDEMLAWLRAGSQLAERFDGFLGSGWVRTAPASNEWHMLYRFADDASLDAWQGSSQRRWWLDAAEAFVEEQHLERRTGIEGWFDEPSAVDVQDLRAVPAPPPRWKQMVSIFIVFYPLSVAANYLAKDYLGTWYLPLRVLATVGVMTPIMTYLALPWITRRLHRWLTA